MKYNLDNKSIASYNEAEKYVFPKYTSQLINLANQNAQGTRPNIVGQLSELFPQFINSLNSSEEASIEKWRKWYMQKYPNALDKAADKIFEQVKNLQNAAAQIDMNMIMNWVDDLIINKTFNGLYIQKAILASLAAKRSTSFRLANPEEEAAGIDGYVGGEAYSVKPDSYKNTMQRLPENISVKKIYYTKTKTGLKIEIED